MVAALDSVLDEVFLGLAKEALPHERGSLVRMHQEHPQSARCAVAEVVEVIMRAKCFRADWPFLRSCRPLFVLAEQHRVVATLFSVAARLDLSDAQNNPLYDPTMQEIVNLRVEQILGCLRALPNGLC